MDELAAIEQEIEKVRNVLNGLVSAKREDTSHPEVTDLSAKLDRLIVRYAQLKLENEAKRGLSECLR